MGHAAGSYPAVTVEVVPGAQGCCPLFARTVHTADGAVPVLNSDRHSDALHIAYGHPAHQLDEAQIV
jgi:hypothetical protein